MLYFLLSTLVLTLYIDVVLSLSIQVNNLRMSGTAIIKTMVIGCLIISTFYLHCIEIRVLIPLSLL